MNALFINFVIYFLTTLFFFKTDRKISLRVFVMSIYTIMAFASYYCIANDLILSFIIYKEQDNSLIPYLLNYICILSMTLLLTNSHKYIENEYIVKLIDNKYVQRIEYIIIIVNFIYIIMMFFYAQLLLSFGFKEIYEMVNDDQVIFTFGNSIMNVLFYRSKDIIRFVTPFFLLLQFAKLSLHKQNKKTVGYIVLFVLPELFLCLLLSNRGGIFFCMMQILFYIILFWSKFNLKLKKSMIRILGLFSGLTIIYMINITISRADDDIDRAWESYVVGYWGQSYCNLGWTVWNASGEYIGGERKFPELFSLIGENNAPEYAVGLMRNHYYEQISKFPITQFKTFWGDLFCEFGLVLSLIVVVVYNFIIKWMKRSLRVSVLVIIILSMHYNTLIWGLFNANITGKYLYNLFMVFVLCYILNRKFKLYECK